MKQKLDKFIDHINEYIGFYFIVMAISCMSILFIYHYIHDYEYYYNKCINNEHKMTEAFCKEYAYTKAY